MVCSQSELFLASTLQQQLKVTLPNLTSRSLSTPSVNRNEVDSSPINDVSFRHPSTASGSVPDSTPAVAITVTSGTTRLSFSGNLRPSPLNIPEILQEICHYLDRSTLVHVSRVCKQFWTCSSPLLWTRIPEHAWNNAYFRTNWHRHGSQIMTMCCGPGVDLGIVSLHCQNLISLDVSRIREPIRTESKLDMVNAYQSGYPKGLSNSIQSQSKVPNPGKLSMQDHSADNYDSFLKMTDGLVRVIRNNKNLRCLQLKPIGRFPPRLLEALSQLDHLEFLSLNAWRDFQEYSLQLIMEACPGLSHLSLGENDFTRCTLETIHGNQTPKLSKPGLHRTDKSKARYKLERYDDPIKGRAGPNYVDHDPMEIYSKRAVYDTQSIPSSSHQTLDYPALYHSSYHQYLNQQTITSTQINIKTLSLHQSGLQQEFLVRLTSLCPRLEHLSLLNGWGFYPSTKFASILSQACPNLRRLEFREQALDLQDEFFISLCRHIPRLQWIHAGMTGFSNGALDSIRVQCKDITSLNLDGTRGIQSKALDQLLRTCYSLRVMSARGVVLNARDMDRGSKWACRGLETLVLDIEIYAAITMPQSSGHNSRNQLSNQDSVKAVREYVYDQLGDLTRLQLLGIGGGHPVGGTEPGVDLTLESGLQKLDTLHCLEKLDIRRLARTQGENDLAWMVRQWPRFCSLEVSKGRTIKQTNDKTHKAIEWLSRTRPGMKISLI